MLPLFKLFSLFVRILARPVIARTKAHTSSKLKDEKLRLFFVWLGNKTHRVNVYVNRTFLKLNNDNLKIQDLSESSALELGVETFYELIIYACILGLPIIELYRAHVDGLEKSAKQKELMESISSKLKKLDNQNQDQQKHLEQLTCINNILYRKSTVLENVLVTQKVLKQQNPLLTEIEELNKSLLEKIQFYEAQMKKPEQVEQVEKVEKV